MIKKEVNEESQVSKMIRQSFPELNINFVVNRTDSKVTANKIISSARKSIAFSAKKLDDSISNASSRKSSEKSHVDLALTLRSKSPTLFVDHKLPKSLRRVEIKMITPKIPISHPRYNLKYSSAAYNIIKNIKPYDEFQPIDSLREEYIKQKEKKLQKFKSLYLKSSFVRKDLVSLKQSEDNIRKLYKKSAVSNPVYYEKKKKRFVWEGKPPSTDRPAVDKVHIRGKKSQVEIEQMLGPLPQWLINNKSFKKSFKKSLQIKRSEIIQLAEKPWFQRTLDEQSVIKKYLMELDSMQGYDDLFFNIMSMDVGCVQLLENSYLFSRNEVIKFAYIVHDGSLKHEESGHVFTKGDIINKDILERKRLNEDDSYIVTQAAVLFTLSKKSYDSFVHKMLEHRRDIIVNLLQSEIYFSGIPIKYLETLVENSILRFRKKGESNSINQLLGIMTYGQLRYGASYIVSGSARIVVPVMLDETIKYYGMGGSAAKGSIQLRQEWKEHIEEHHFIDLYLNILSDQLTFDAFAEEDTWLIEFPRKMYKNLFSSEQWQTMVNESKYMSEELMRESKSHVKNNRKRVAKVKNAVANAMSSLIIRRRISKEGGKIKKIQRLFTQIMNNQDDYTPTS